MKIPSPEEHTLTPASVHWHTALVTPRGARCRLRTFLVSCLLAPACTGTPATRLDGTSCRTSAAGTTDCGPNAESCCSSLTLPGGTYDWTYTNDGTGPTGQADPASVSAFRLDKYLITVGRFRQFVAASADGWVPQPGAGKHTHLNGGKGLASAGGGGYEPGWSAGDTLFLPATADEWAAALSCEPSFQTWTDTPGSNESRPINCIDWYDAYAFCIWDGGFLPSEAEWEIAAAGGSEEREYPWGSTDPGTGTLYAITDCNYPAGSTACTGAANIAPVGTAASGAGRWGQLDLAGDLAEWNLDWYADYVSPCTNCVFLTDFSYRVLRGGSFGTNSEIFPEARDGDVPPTGNSFDGARCARAP